MLVISFAVASDPRGWSRGFRPLSQAQLFGRARQAAQGPRLGLCVALPPAPWGSYPLLFPVSIWALWAVGSGRVTRINTK